MINDNLAALRREAAAPDPDPVFSCRGRCPRPRPVLLLTGGIQSPFFLAVARELAACLPSVEHVSVPGAAHAVHAQQPARFNELTLQFLQKHCTRGCTDCRPQATGRPGIYGLRTRTTDSGLGLRNLRSPNSALRLVVSLPLAGNIELARCRRSPSRP